MRRTGAPGKGSGRGRTVGGRRSLGKDDPGAATPGASSRSGSRAGGTGKSLTGSATPKSAPPPAGEVHSQVNEKLAHKLADTVKELASAKEDLAQRKASHLRREKKLQDEIAHLQHELQEAVGQRTAPEQMEYIRSTHGVIQEQLAQMQARQKEVLRQQKEGMTNSFRVKLAEVVDAKAKSNEQEHSAEEWAARFGKAQDHLKRTETQLIDSDRRNKLLESENKRMRAQYRSQENDREFLVRQLVSVKRDNARLREELEGANDRKSKGGGGSNGDSSLSRQRPSTAGSNRSYMSGSRPGSAQTASTSDERMRDTVNRLRKTLERERMQLRQVRAAYATDQQNRTQLEVLMLSCVEDVRREIGRRRQEQRPASRHGRPPSASLSGGNASSDGLDLDEEGRELLMEKLLSQEEVVRMLYEKAFNRSGMPSPPGPRHNSFIGLSRPNTPGSEQQGRAASTEPGAVKLGGQGGGAYMGGGAGGGLSAVRSTRPSSAPGKRKEGQMASFVTPSVYGQISLEDEVLGSVNS